MPRVALAAPIQLFLKKAKENAANPIAALHKIDSFVDDSGLRDAIREHVSEGINQTPTCLMCFDSITSLQMQDAEPNSSRRRFFKHLASATATATALSAACFSTSYADPIVLTQTLEIDRGQPVESRFILHNNKGYAVTIVSIKPKGGCSVEEIAGGKTIQPGDQREVLVRADALAFGHRHVYTVDIKTDERENEHTRLRMVVVPRGWQEAHAKQKAERILVSRLRRSLTFTPEAIKWDQGEEAAEKRIQITLKNVDFNGLDLLIRGGTSPDDGEPSAQPLKTNADGSVINERTFEGFHWRLVRESREGATSWSLYVKPESTDHAVNSRLPVWALLSGVSFPKDDLRYQTEVPVDRLGLTAYASVIQESPQDEQEGVIRD